MGVSSAVTVVHRALPSVVAYSCNFLILPSEIIYYLPDKHLEPRTENDFVQIQKVALNSFQLPIP